MLSSVNKKETNNGVSSWHVDTLASNKMQSNMAALIIVVEMEAQEKGC